MSGYRFLSPAEEEMTEASLFYDAASSGLGSDFLDDVQQAIDRLREYPESGEAVSSNLRRMLLHRFPYSIIYSAETDLILVIAIAHHGRRPEYWQSRIDR
ncbi:MAG TPA: type II toxin-antitoxin system RelE/ParE family toxin [Pyrinomonadaceae bacterium]|nr:type II toxin-antitoxin system RelE/ParE family toxin [Pyrinomonadaceae bacterium]